MSTPITDAMAYAASITDVADCHADCHADRCAVALWEEVLLLRARLAEVEDERTEIQRAWLGGEYGSMPSFFDAVSARINDAERELDRWRSVADGLAEQLREKEGYGPTANLRDYEAAKKGTT
jgi:hypothetical protein